LPHILAAAASIIGAITLSWVPYSLGLMISAIIAMIIGAWAEKWLEGSNL
jgi:hypothetical protein